MLGVPQRGVKDSPSGSLVKSRPVQAAKCVAALELSVAFEYNRAPPIAADVYCRSQPVWGVEALFCDFFQKSFYIQ